MSHKQGHPKHPENQYWGQKLVVQKKIKIGIAFGEFGPKNGSANLHDMGMYQPEFSLVGFWPGPSIEQELGNDRIFCKR